MKGDEIFRACDRHSGKIVTLSKYVAEYEEMRKWMVQFFTRFQGRSIKIAPVNSIRQTIDFFLYLIVTPSDVTIRNRFILNQIASTVFRTYILG